MNVSREWELDLRSNTIAHIIIEEYKTDPAWNWDKYVPVEIVNVIEKSAYDEQKLVIDDLSLAAKTLGDRIQLKLDSGMIRSVEIQAFVIMLNKALKEAKGEKK